MTKILLIRHAEAEGNIYRRIHGHYDSRVTPRGLRQIEKLAERFAGVHIGAVYSSDLFRARRTAEAFGLPVTTDARLREMNMGSWEDMPFGEVIKFDPEQARNLDYDPWNLSVPGLEPFRAVGVRAEAAMREIARANDGGTVAVVTHAMITGAFFDNIGASDNTAMVPNTSVSCLTFDGVRFALQSVGDASHLPPELDTAMRRRINIARLGGVAKGNLRYVRTADYAWDALLGDEIVGAVAVDISPNDGKGVISRLEIFPGYRGAGLGTQLFGQGLSVDSGQLIVDSYGGLDGGTV